MGKPNCDNGQFFDRISSPTSIVSPLMDSDIIWHSPLSQSDPSIQSRPNQITNRSLAVSSASPLPPQVVPALHSASYKVSIGHETVNITELPRPHELSSDPTIAIPLNDRRRLLNTQKGANILSLCFMCFVSAALILIAISTMHLLFKTDYINSNNMMPFLLQSVNITSGFLYMFPPSTPSMDKISQLIIPVFDYTIRDLATTICILIIVLNCFSLLVFSIEIYLGCNTIVTKRRSYRNINLLFSSSTSRFLAICGFYTSIPALILVMCFFILMNMSLVPAVVSLVILGFGLIFILITLLTYFSTIKTNNFSAVNGKIDIMNSSLYQVNTSNHLNDDDIDLTKTDELSTLV